MYKSRRFKEKHNDTCEKNFVGKKNSQLAQEVHKPASQTIEGCETTGRERGGVLCRLTVWGGSDGEKYCCGERWCRE